MLTRCAASLVRSLPRSVTAVKPTQRRAFTTTAMLLRVPAVAAAVPQAQPASRHAGTAGLAPAPAPSPPLLRRGLLTRPRAAAGDKGDPQQQQQQPQQQAGATAGGGSELQPPPPQQQDQVATASGGGGGQLDMLGGTLLPSSFRRMANHMLQMQREMDDMLSTFAAPLMGPAAVSTIAADPYFMMPPLDPFAAAAATEPAVNMDPKRLFMTTPGRSRGGGGGALLGPGGRLVPVMEVEERETEYVVTAEVSMSEDGLLTLTGAHTEAFETHTPISPEPTTTSTTSTTAAAGTEPEQATTVPTPPGIPGTSRRPPGLTATTGSSRRYTSFVRALRLPVGGVDPDGIRAATQHGVLTVTIPKKAQAAPKVREIPVA
ncbi:hypothetical protein HYH02_011543 [Chlamydomonas schloesseri]|uniref:SHSP domain-containing protein n=1 Tax=Chlamydomonas schloesseri TaxID=2026947 RepID=A0A835T5Q6_9CHLO|nr:hypothetical protein HYH02_011543 [Chlamydomonas schloesseri]|eukprot:KAG2436608.1 hypothetical protein HYH02_011543 [Chlamydomonas schloesseri]